MVEAKHEFIDDNPYLVYSPDAEATASGSGGLVVVTSDTGGYPSMSADEIIQNVNAGNSVVFREILDKQGDVLSYSQLSFITAGENKTAVFTGFIVTEGEENKTVIEGSSVSISTKESPIVVYRYEG